MQDIAAAVDEPPPAGGVQTATEACAMPRLPHPADPSRSRRSLRWMRPLPLLGAALLIFQLGGRGQARTLEPLADPPAPRPVIADATDHGDVTQGALRITRGEEEVECPLKHTDVKADVSGFIARVRVTQTFENPYDE